LAEAVWIESPLLASGMQKDELTMFQLSCYSSLVPRVNPGLVWL
jgi:hypothetical protein